jgi:hypothetical protein
MSPRFYLIPLAIVGVGAGVAVNRHTRDHSEHKATTVLVSPVPQHDWCAERPRSNRGWHCEVREFSFAGSELNALDASPNGSIEVKGWNSDAVQVLAKIQANARSDADAFDLVSEVRIAASGVELKASGPKSGRNESWSVSYRADVPHRSNWSLHATNGGIAVEDVSGNLELGTANGSITLRAVGGDVQGRAVNGSIKAELAGNEWDGAGLNLRTTNGSIDILMSGEYNAVLESATTNGAIQVDFPVTVTGRISRRLHTELGDGGALIKAVTTNGAVRIRQNDD